MNLRISLSAVIVLSIVSVVAVWIVQNRPGDAVTAPDLPFFYTLAPDDIRHINIDTLTGDTDFSLKPDERVWYFDDPVDTPVNRDRFGGMTFLLGGPKIQRELSDDVGDDSVFGLDDPGLVVTLSLRDGTSVGMELGDLTPDGEAQYARLVGFPQLVLVDSSWGQVIGRLVDEPPFPNWRYTMNAGNAKEVLFFKGNEVVRGIGFHEDQGWVECDIPENGNIQEVPCAGTTPINVDGLQPWLAHLATPEFTGVAQVLREQDDATAEQFGITLDAPHIIVRLEEQKRKGVIEVTNISMTLGDLSPNGTMYVQAMQQPDIAEVDAAWGQQVLKFFDDKSFVDQ